MRRRRPERIKIVVVGVQRDALVDGRAMIARSRKRRQHEERRLVDAEVVAQRADVIHDAVVRVVREPDDETDVA